ncbi:hypothetical protein FRC03_004766 [Tulasnella sp. 419]|nr:hypothetical protein FRC03_004766 [Tulasnella sp. 419]
MSENSKPNGSAQSQTYKPAGPATKSKLPLLIGNHDDFLEGKVMDESYEFNKYLPTFPNVKWDPLGPIDFEDKGLKADPSKKNLFDAATKVDHLTPLIGTEISGIDLRYLTDQQKNDLALLVAERGVVFFRNQDITIEEQTELSRYFGQLYVHPFSGIPKGLDHVHVVYTDAKMRFDSSAYAKRDVWHSDVTYELQPPGIAILKLMVVPPVGADTLWGTGTGLYSNLSPAFRDYLEKLEAVHDIETQAMGAVMMGWPLRRDPIKTIHPLVRVHPVTGWKSIFVNAAFTTRIANVPQSESDFVLNYLFRETAENPELHVRFRWQKNDVAIWDNRIAYHSVIGNGGAYQRHGLRTMNHAEVPLSITEYEKKYGKPAQNRAGRLMTDVDIWNPVSKEEVKKPVANGTTNGMVVTNGTASPPSDDQSKTENTEEQQDVPSPTQSGGLTNGKLGVLAPSYWMRGIKSN